MNARYYNGHVGKFVSEDPVFWEVGLSEDGKRMLQDPQLQNSYSYAGNNPVTNKDPNGRCFWDMCVAEAVLGYGLLAYTAVDAGSDIYVADLAFRRYSDQFSVKDKIDAVGQIGLDAISFGIGKFGFTTKAESTLFDSLTTAYDAVTVFASKINQMIKKDDKSFIKNNSKKNASFPLSEQQSNSVSKTHQSTPSTQMRINNTISSYQSIGNQLQQIKQQVQQIQVQVNALSKKN